jgi:hypothetical protein
VDSENASLVVVNHDDEYAKNHAVSFGKWTDTELRNLGEWTKDSFNNDFRDE